jgi:hypothetical protein
MHRVVWEAMSVRSCILLNFQSSIIRFCSYLKTRAIASVPSRKNSRTRVQRRVDNMVDSSIQS